MSSAQSVASILMIGAHDTGKSNYLARLWLALRRCDGLLGIPEDAEHVEYVEQLITELRSGRYVGRTDNDGEARNFEGRAIISAGRQQGTFVEILVPDVAGELWETASGEREVERQWVERIRQCRGALLFLRFGSKHHVDALNWVTSAAAMSAPIAQLVEKPFQISTQIFLTDMMNVLEANLGKASPNVTPRVAVIVAGWDLFLRRIAQGGPPRMSIRHIRCSAGGCWMTAGWLSELSAPASPVEICARPTIETST